MYITKFSFNKMKNKNYHTVGTVPKITTLSEQFQKLPHCRNSSKNYHTVGTVPKITTLSEQFQKLPHCRNSSKNYHTVGTVPKFNRLRFAEIWAFLLHIATQLILNLRFCPITYSSYRSVFTVLPFVSPFLWFPHKNDVRFVFTSSCL